VNVASALQDYLSEEQLRSIRIVTCNLEFLPISCLHCRGDEVRVISANRVIPDDFIYIPSKGALDCLVGEERRTIQPGEFMMVPAGQRHGVTMGAGVKEYEVFALHMHLYDETRHRFLQKLDSPFGSLSNLDGWLTRLTTCTCLMGRDPKTGGEYMRHLVISLLIEQFLHGRGMLELPQQTDQRIARLLGRIRVRPSDNWTVAGMAKDCHLSVSRFRELFAICTGTSPKKYLQNVRLSLARSLLVTMPELTVEQVAEKVGISDPHYFHAVYKDRFGKTPKNSVIPQEG
jgi:AraC-like DNA-binding protein